jgi:hypothetical protein
VTPEVLAVLGVVGTVVVGPLVTFLLTRRKSAAETERTVADTLGVVIDRLEADNERLARELDRARGEREKDEA